MRESERAIFWSNPLSFSSKTPTQDNFHKICKKITKLYKEITLMQYYAEMSYHFVRFFAASALRSRIYPIYSTLGRCRAFVLHSSAANATVDLPVVSLTLKVMFPRAGQR